MPKLQARRLRSNMTEAERQLWNLDVYKHSDFVIDAIYDALTHPPSGAARHLPPQAGKAGFLVALGLAVALALCAASVRATPIDIHASIIPLYPDHPSERRAGSLIYRGGLQLSSTSRDFGGWSDIAVSTDGSQLLSISDRSHWLKARILYDANGDLIGVTNGDLSPLLGENGAALRGRNGDSEGMTLERPGDLNSAAIISFERNVRVLRYDLSKGFSATPTNIAIGNWVKPLHDNQQLEAITLWKPDTLLVFAETKVNPGDDLLAAMEAYPGDGTPHTRMLSVVPHDPFAITSAANAPDGGIYLLERRFTILGGAGMELRHIPAVEIKPGARLNGAVLANLSILDSNIDNMEGVAVHKGARGETLLTIVSDDNYSLLQRTLLLMFEVRN